MGCHGGLPVPGSNPADVNHSLDLPQTLLSRGVVAYVANSGYGWGPKFGPGYSKRLMELLTELLAVPGTIVTGDAVREAKLRYFDQTGSPDPYDAKSLMQWTFYGLPMYAVKTGIAAPAASSSSSSVQLQRRGAPKAASKAAVEHVGGVTVVRQAATLSAAAWPTVPPSLTQLDLRFDFTAAGVYQKRGASGSLVTHARVLRSERLLLHAERPGHGEDRPARPALLRLRLPPLGHEPARRALEGRDLRPGVRLEARHHRARLERRRRLRPRRRPARDRHPTRRPRDACPEATRPRARPATRR